MDESQVTANVVDEKSAVSSWSGVVQVFTSPGEFFERLRSQPRVLIPYLVLFVISVITMVMIGDMIWEWQKSSPEFQERLQGQELTPEIEQISKISTMVVGALMILLFPLMQACLSIFFGNFIFAGESRFKQHLSVMLYGDILAGIGGLLASVFTLMKGEFGFTFSLAVLAGNAGPSDPLWVALSKISVFHIWEIIVVGIGLAAVYQFSRNKGLWVSVLSLGLLSAIGVLLALVGSMF